MIPGVHCIRGISLARVIPRGGSVEDVIVITVFLKLVDNLLGAIALGKDVAWSKSAFGPAFSHDLVFRHSLASAHIYQNLVSLFKIYLVNFNFLGGIVVHASLGLVSPARSRVGHSYVTL